MPATSQILPEKIGVKHNVAADEADLISRLVRGDEEAFCALVKEHAGWMLNLARRLLNCEADAADCVQESFAILFEKIAGFEGRSTLKTWLHRVVANQALMKIRKKTNLREKPLEHHLQEFDGNGLRIGPVLISDESIETLVSGKEIATKVRLAIAELPDIYRTILILRDLEGYSTAEAAKFLDVEEGTIRTRLHRARHTLRKTLEPTMGAKYLGDIL